MTVETSKKRTPVAPRQAPTEGWQTLPPNGVSGLLQGLRQTKATGALRLKNGETRKLVYLKEGLPIAARSNLVRECLGNLLVSNRQISPEDCASSLRHMKTLRKRQGEVLIAMGKLTKAQLHEALAMQHAARIEEVLSWASGEFLFRSHVSPPPRTEVLKTVTAEALLPSFKDRPASTRVLEEEMQLQALREKKEALEKLDHFQRLGVTPHDGTETIRRAFFNLAREYHPERHASPETRQQAQLIYNLLATAHETLSEPLAKERYLTQLAFGIKKNVSAHLKNLLEAEALFREGEDALFQEDFSGARACFEKAVFQCPDEAEYLAYFAWSLFREKPDNLPIAQKSLDTLAKASKLAPRLDVCHVFAGHIHKALGAWKTAQQHFEKALLCNPGCKVALRELGRRPTNVTQSHMRPSNKL